MGQFFCPGVLIKTSGTAERLGLISKAFSSSELARPLSVVVLVLALGQGARSEAGSATLAWDYENDPSVQAYNLYYGPVAGAYTNFVSAGSMNQTTVSNLSAGETYYFAVTAVNSAGLESVFSSPVSYWIPVQATMTLGNLRQIYNGSPRPVSLTVVPADLPTTVTYNGSTNPPVEAGSYQVVASVLDTNHSGTATETLAETLVVAKANAAINVGYSYFVYDGLPKEPRLSTAPSGLTLTVMYDGQRGPPTNAGVYTFTAEISDPNYTGASTGTLTIAKEDALVALTSPSWAFDGTRKTASASTIPPGLPIAITYNGQSQAPYAPGSYVVLVAVTDPNYQGSAAGLLTITNDPSSARPHPAQPFQSNSTSVVSSQVTVTPTWLQIAWPASRVTHGVNLFESSDLLAWKPFLKGLWSTNSVLVPQESRNHFFRAFTASPDGSNLLPLAVRGTTTSSRLPAQPPKTSPQTAN